MISTMLEISACSYRSFGTAEGTTRLAVDWIQWKCSFCSDLSQLGYINKCLLVNLCYSLKIMKV